MKRQAGVVTVAPGWVLPAEWQPMCRPAHPGRAGPQLSGGGGGGPIPSSQWGRGLPHLPPQPTASQYSPVTQQDTARRCPGNQERATDSNPRLLLLSSFFFFPPQELKTNKPVLQLNYLKFYGAQFHNQNSTLVGGGSCTDSLAFSSDEFCNWEIWFPPRVRLRAQPRPLSTRRIFTFGAHGA